MGFATGAVSFRRYFICGDHPNELTEDWLTAIQRYAFGRGAAGADGIDTGWIVPTHLFDVDFRERERIAFGRFVFLALRVDRTAPPSSIVASYRKMEEAAALAASESDFLTRQDRRLAREAAAERAEKEARAGAFRRIAAYPLLIDLEEGVVYFGNLGSTAGDRLLGLFADTFNVTLTLAGPDEVAYRCAEKIGQTLAFEAATPLLLVDPPTPDVDGAAHPGVDRTFLGREFLTWLWYGVDRGEGLFETDDGKTLTLAIDRSMKLECTFDLTGTDAIRSDAPASLPEAHAALRVGKQPTKMGLLIGTAGEDWSLTLDGPQWHMSGLSLPKPEEGEDAPPVEDRLHRIREAARLIDGLYASFLRKRLGPQWSSEESNMRQWASQRPGAAAPIPQRATA